MNDVALLNTLEAIRSNPSGYYVNVHSLSNRPGLIRGQLRRADHMMLSMLLQKAADSEAVDMSQSRGHPKRSRRTLPRFLVVSASFRRSRAYRRSLGELCSLSVRAMAGR